MDGDCVTAQVDRPYGLCYDDTNALVYFCDAVNHRIRVIHLATNMVATVVGNGEEGMLFKNRKIKIEKLKSKIIKSVKLKIKNIFKTSTYLKCVLVSDLGVPNLPFL